MKYLTECFDQNGESCCQHSALTGFFRHHWAPNAVRDILYECSVSGHVGALPPQLRKLIAHKDIPSITKQFHIALDNFVAKKFYVFSYKARDQIYEIPELGRLFNTKCLLAVQGYANQHGTLHPDGRTWAGAVSTVCKLSFPEFGLDYALKMFNKVVPLFLSGSHGANEEIPTAFAACRAEPRDNNPVYMASLRDRPYMLSLWTDAVPLAKLQRVNQFEIFRTFGAEINQQNFHAGRRIDYGGTYLTVYGAANWTVRKLCRKMVFAANRKDDVAMQKMREEAIGYIAKQEFNQAIACVRDIRPFWYDSFTYNFVNAYRIR